MVPKQDTFNLGGQNFCEKVQNCMLISVMSITHFVHNFKGHSLITEVPKVYLSVFSKKALKVRIHRDIFKLIYSRHNLITLISYFALLQSLEACYIPVEACKIYFGVFCETDFFKVKAQKRTRVHQFNTTQKSEVACTFYILQKHHNQNVVKEGGKLHTFGVFGSSSSTNSHCFYFFSLRVSSFFSSVKEQRETQSESVEQAP